MSDRLDAFQIVKGTNGFKDYWRKIGVAFSCKDGNGFRLKLTAIPVPEDGEYVVMLREPLPARNEATGGPAAFDTDLDDDVPF